MADHDPSIRRAVTPFVDELVDCISDFASSAKDIAGRLDDPAAYTADQAADDFVGSAIRAMRCASRLLGAGLNLVTEMSEGLVRSSTTTVVIDGGPRPATIDLTDNLVGSLPGRTVPMSEVKLRPTRLTEAKAEVTVTVSPLPKPDFYTMFYNLDVGDGTAPVGQQTLIRL